MRNLLFAIAAALAAVFPAAAQTDPDVIWQGGFENGSASFSGNCSSGQSEWCRAQIIRPAQAQIVADPVAQGRTAARFEVKYGDKYSYYSDARTLLTGPPELWEDEGNERWYRWQALWPQDWVGSYPKWDQLYDPVSFRSNAGSIVEWHHDANGGVESGSAPLYVRGNDTDIEICLVDQATSACRETITLAPLQRSHWHDFVMHAKWSSNKSVGFLEIWIDGVLVLPKHFAANKYPGMRNYMVVGLYRNGHIGDPNLRWPDGTRVYGNDGAPGVVYLDGFIIGKTQQSVLASRPWGPQSAPAPAPAPDPGVPDAGVEAPPADAPDAGTAVDSTQQDPKQPAVAAIGLPGGGCTSTGAQLAWIALPIIALLALRRRGPVRHP